MNRRAFLATVAGVGAALAGQSACAPSATIARLSVDYGNPGRPIPADFTGLSYESAVLAANDFFTPDNRTLIRLLRTLGSRGVLRIGGNTSERTVWGPPATKVSRENFLVTPGAVDRLALFLRALDWQLIYGLNLASGHRGRCRHRGGLCHQRGRPAASRFADRQRARRLRPMVGSAAARL